MSATLDELRTVLEHMPESVAIYDLDGRVRYVNPATEVAFGHTLADMQGKRLWDLFPDAVGNLFHAAFERVAAGGPREVFEHYYPPFDRWFDNRIDRFGDRVHVVGRDVTDEVRRRRRLEALARISAVLTKDDLGFEASLAELASVLAEILNADTTVALLSADRAWLETVASAAREDEALALLRTIRRWNADSGHPGQAVRTREVVLANETSAATELAGVADPGTRESVTAYAPSSLLVAPLLAGDETIGVLLCSRRKHARPLTADDRTLVSAIAPSIGLYVAHARRRAEATSLRRRLESLLAVTVRLATADTADAIARIVVDEGVTALDANIGGLWLLSGDGRELIMQRSRGFTAAQEAAFARFPVDGSGAVSTCLVEARPVWIESRADYAARYPAHEAKHRPIPAPPLAFALVPLLAEGRPIGCVNVTFHDERRIGADERTYLEVLVAHAAEALRRARLYADLRDASQTRQAMIQASPAAIMLLDRARTVHAWNPAAERIFGWTADETLGRPLPGVPADCSDELAEDVASVLAGHVIEGRVTRRLRKTGEAFDVALHAAPVRLSEGRELCLAMVFDVSERLRTERGKRLVAEASARLARSFESHDAVDEVLGMVASELADGGLLELATRDEPVRTVVVGHDPRAALTRSVLAAPLAIGDRSFGRIVLGSRGRRFDDVDRAILGEVASHAATALDNARLYREARSARRDAEAASRAKDEFLAMLGHELRNPLAPITTALDLMRLRSPGQVQREREVIGRQVAHLSRLVDDLLDVSRITRGKIDLQRQRTSVAEIVAKAIELTSPLLEQRQHQLTVNVPPELAVHGDPVRLGQVVANLLSNSAKYTNVGGRVDVHAEREGGDVVITVRDNGVGISEDMLPTVFDMFVQAPQSRARLAGGLGLGLAIVRSLVALHGGRVEAQSEGENRGSRFVVRLPAAPTSIEAGPPPSDANAPRRVTTRRVLIVDDNEDAAVLLGAVLDTHGHEIRTAFDGPSALRIAEEFRPEVAILDIGLPVMDGYELAARLRARDDGRPARLIAVTGYGQEADRARSREAGFEAHLAKPVSTDTLVRLIEAPIAS